MKNDATTQDEDFCAHPTTWENDGDNFCRRCGQEVKKRCIWMCDGDTRRQQWIWTTEQ